MVSLTEPDKRVATVGTFDGLHRGHQLVISKVKAIAAGRGLKPTVISFDRHPLETIAPERAPRLLQSPAERVDALVADGIDVISLEFTPGIARLTAREWLRILRDNYGVKTLVLGYDNKFGSDGRTLTLADYQSLGDELGVEIVTAPHEPGIGSSVIRRLVGSGNVEEAAGLLGRPYAITGMVVPGKRMGSGIGFPTANLRPSSQIQLPANGVYAAEATLPAEFGSKIMPAIVNIGTQPTVAEDAPLRIEIHIPGFSGDLYGRPLKVNFLHRIRDERKFDSVEALKNQIQHDLSTLSSYFLKKR